MKIKQKPEDFQVVELTDVTSGDFGPFSFYRLEKTGWTTPDALQAIRRRWQIDHRRFSYGGLKDRHAQTVQYLTIFRGPARNLTHQRLKLTYLGKLAEPFTSAAVRANQFRLVVRALRTEEVAPALSAVIEVRRDGIPNYFDDQRFGSVGPGGQFMARSLVRGEYEEALRLALTAHYEFDRAEQKREKAILRQKWGDWQACKDALPRGHARSLVDFLVHHSQDFAGAIARLRPELRGLYLAAYQSHLWNRMLARWLRINLRPSQLIPIKLKLGEVPIFRQLDDSQRQELAHLDLPLPSHRLQLDPTDPRAAILDAILHEEKIELGQFKLRGFKEMFFSRGERAALCSPHELEAHAEADELNSGRHCLHLAFQLPRGSYATLIVKRVCAQKHR
jgi:tRNA pseudouridine13 synthase